MLPQGQSLQEKLTSKEEGFTGRLKELVAAVGGVDVAAELTNKSTGLIYRYLKGDHVPGLMATATLADKAGLSLNWVVTGSGEKRLNNEPDQDSELTLLQTERPGFEIALGSSLLTEDQLKKRSVKALISDHDHMSPTIKNGDIVILDKSVTDFTAGVFFVRVSNQDLLCRTSITPFKTIFSFDNSSYIGFEVTKEELKEVTCLGRVIWVCSKL